MDASQLPLFADIDILQVGARNMQNFSLLKALGKQDKPVLLKRGLSSTYEEWLMSAEYVLAGGNNKVILCERGIRTFETYTRNTLDVSCVPVLRQMTHLPIIIDPSHACGRYQWVPALANAGIAAGADGVLIEVHNDPQHAKCDGLQSLTPDRFAQAVPELKAIHEIVRGNGYN
jgi:3-deoxy-7-phosphoheptulonate synthase